MFSSMRVTVWPAGVSAASSGRQATGMLERLPTSGMACSMPQYDGSNRGLTRTMSAMTRTLLARGTGLSRFVRQGIAEGGARIKPSRAAALAPQLQADGAEHQPPGHGEDQVGVHQVGRHEQAAGEHDQ